MKENGSGSMNQAGNPIGVFDSGVGGISVLQAMIRVLPQEHFIYYGDTANAPYGTKKTEEVIDCVRKVTDRLLERNIKALVIACNTATGAAAYTLRKELAIPVIGMEPALKPASAPVPCRSREWHGTGAEARFRNPEERENPRAGHPADAASGKVQSADGKIRRRSRSCALHRADGTG